MTHHPTTFWSFAKSVKVVRLGDRAGRMTSWSLPDADGVNRNHLHRRGAEMARHFPSYTRYAADCIRPSQELVILNLLATAKRMC